MRGTRTAHARLLAPAGATLLAAAALALAPGPVVADTSAAPRIAPAAPFDLDGDGYGDLATGVPLATADHHYGAGAVSVLYGSRRGVSAAGNRLVSQSTAGVVGGSESLDQFGTSVASGDFDADGFADLAVGAIGEDRPSDGTKPFGAVTVLPGSEAGVSGAGSRRFRPADAGSDQVWGGGEATGDLDGDGYDDLVVSAGSQSFDEQVDGVSVLYGSPTGLTAARAVTIDNTSAYEQQADRLDTFGSSFSVGDITGDGIDDLAVAGHRGEVGHQVGGVAVFHGRAGGVGTAADETYQGSSPGLASGGWEYSPGFATAVALGDYDADGHADLALSDPDAATPDTAACQETGGCTGGLVVLPGTDGGLDADRATFLTQRSNGVPPGPGARQPFGARLTSGDVDGDGSDDLAVGIAGAASGSTAATGAVLVLRGDDAGGLSGAGARRWTQSTAGVPGVSEEQDLFGSSLRVVDLGRGDVRDLVVQAAGETVGGAQHAGAATVLYGRLGTGPVTDGAQVWTLDTRGVRGTAGRYHRFGTLDQ
jgi:hypothetical protein